jgi:hypothetical protein
MRAHFGVCRLGDVDEVDAIRDPISEQAVKLPDRLIGIEAFLDDLDQRRLELAGHLDRHAPIVIVKPRADLLVRVGGIIDGASQQSGKALGYPRGSGPRWRADRPYHVALEDTYIRAHWDEIYTLWQVNSLPFNSTGEIIQNDGMWRVYEFTWQMDAILFWDRFNGRWLRGTEFQYPERPVDLPSLKPLENWPKFNPRDTR